MWGGKGEQKWQREEKGKRKKKKEKSAELGLAAVCDTKKGTDITRRA